MAAISFISRLLILSLGLPLVLMLSCAANSEDILGRDRESYIVYMGGRTVDAGELSVSSSLQYVSMMQSVVGSKFSPDLLVKSFKRSFRGFVVKLTDTEAQKIAALAGVVSIFRDESYQLQTTTFWDFVGFPQNVERLALERDIVIGMLDSGIWPESESFNDVGLGSPRTKWKGICQSSSNFTCNNKIIGARFYDAGETPAPGGFASPRDSEGHGTHTASTAAGGPVTGASLDGFGNGTARGGAPSARIAVYKICSSFGCPASSILAAFDDAIADGVDIISLSVGAPFATDYFRDPIAIGAFHAMKNGILTSNSGGNAGPARGTTGNVSPWSLSVAASTIDRRFVTEVQLGNNITYQGASINTFDLNGTMFPIVYAGYVPNTKLNFTGLESRFCVENSLDPRLVRGKIVLCAKGDKEAPLLAGAIGSVVPGDQDVAGLFPIPASQLTVEDIREVFTYINGNSNATATIRRSTEVKDKSASFVPLFSSRGPNTITPDILKPDIAAPGVDILAAWSPVSPISEVAGDRRFSAYNIISGTSMACPHVTGAAAYVKSFHPTWSPSAIKSALMTTASPMSSATNPDAELAYGAGQLNPVKAVNPGLIYDAEPSDYVKFLCGQGYSTRLVRLITGDRSACSRAINQTVFNLNYPSFALSISGPSRIASRAYKRVVTNVGTANSSYKAIVTAPPGLKIHATPDVLSFNYLGEKKSFTLKIEGAMAGNISSASLMWDDGQHRVRSPIAVFSAEF